MSASATRAGAQPVPGLDAALALDAAALRTPALVIDADAVAGNIAAMVRAIGGDPRRWRPHVKTAKLPFVFRQLLGAGLSRFKCATTLELATLLDAGATDVLVAFPHAGANVARIREIAAANPAARVTGLIEAPVHLDAWRDSGLDLFADLNPGMNRTGGVADADRLASLAAAIGDAGCTFTGLHWYDGHMHGFDDLAARERAAHAGYDRLGAVVAALAARGVAVGEVIVAGTPAAVAASTYAPFAEWPTEVTVSPGTVVYNDTTSLAQLPPDWGLVPAVHVVATVVSHPTLSRFTCDAGHKAVSADAGVPTCAIVGHPDWSPQRPSEEHLPVDVAAGSPLPPIGSRIALRPRHVCPTVNNFDHAVIAAGGRLHVEPVTARGREIPLASHSWRS